MPWCGEHPVSEMSVYGAERRSYCRACRREREAATHYGDHRCRRGHLKTPWTWRSYKGHNRCLTCQYELERKRRAERERTPSGPVA